MSAQEESEMKAAGGNAVSSPEPVAASPIVDTTASTDTSTSTASANTPTGQQSFPTAYGHMTKRMQQSFLQKQVDMGKIPQECFQDEHVISLQASSPVPDNEPPSPLYFWQLFSLLGRAAIFRLAETFYTRVFDDLKDEEWKWFAEAFGRPNVKHHALFLGMALVDCFGGGKMYAGGDERLDDVHASAAHTYMTHQGAIRWSHHMRHALDQEQLHGDWDKIDVRIRPTISTYFDFFMNRYAEIYDFSMDQVEFG